MDTSEPATPQRRRGRVPRVLGTGLALAATDPGHLPVHAVVAGVPQEQAPVDLPVPADCAVSPLTPAQTEGPYFTPGSPERSLLIEPGVVGKRLVISGYVYASDCQPVAGALLDFWQADAQGRYDNSGYQLRGHVSADAWGYFDLETVVPGLYPGRTRHIHTKVEAPGQPVLTTPIYVPDEPNNRRDGIYRPETVLRVQDTAAGKLGTISFVLAQ